MNNFEIYIFPINSDTAIDVTKVTCPICKSQMEIRAAQYDEPHAPKDTRICPEIHIPTNETAGYTYITKCRRCQSELTIPMSRDFRYH